MMKRRSAPDSNIQPHSADTVIRFDPHSRVLHAVQTFIKRPQDFRSQHRLFLRNWVGLYDVSYTVRYLAFYKFTKRPYKKLNSLKGDRNRIRHIWPRPLWKLANFRQFFRDVRNGSLLRLQILCIVGLLSNIGLHWLPIEFTPKFKSIYMQHNSVETYII